MTPANQKPSRYDSTTVERALLEFTVELHPKRVTAERLRAEIVSDPNDVRAVEIAEEAISQLREFGVLSDSGDVFWELHRRLAGPRRF
jgi:hypothetical protein